MMSRASLVLAASTAALLAATPAHAQRDRSTQVTPYIGIDQTVVSDLKGGTGDTLTYTSVIAGVDASIRTRSSEVNASISYQHQFTWADNDPDADVVSGLVRARTTLGTRSLNLEGGALATRVRTDGFTGANGSLAGAGSTSHIYSLYAGPTYAGHLGDVDVTAAYRLGYNRLEDSRGADVLGTPLDSFDESWNQLATASIGMQPDVWLPIGWSASVGYAREDASQLDQRFENKWGRVDITVPLTPSLAGIGGVGYQSIEASNRDAQRDTAGEPVRDANGRFITDPASPRILSYDNDEMIWDVGIQWRPSRRTALQLTYGHRYGSGSLQGSFNWQPDQDTSVNISIFDSVDSFGRAMSGNLANLPSNFVVTRNPFSGDLSGCAFGTGSGDPCIGNTLSGIRTANYRNRGISASYAHRAGPWNYGIGLGYSRRTFLGRDPIFDGLDGLKEENYFAAAQLGYAIDDRSNINLNLYANQFTSEIAGVADVFNAGAYLNYSRSISRRLQLNAALGLDHAKASGVDSVLSGLAQIGVRYSF